MSKVDQVGGTHYAAEYQHWDWTTDLCIPYLGATATKYLSRWQKKNGVQDIQKCKSYLRKALATWNTYSSSLKEMPIEDVECLTIRFAFSADLGIWEHAVCLAIATGTRQSYEDALVIVERIEAAAQARQQGQAKGAGATAAATVAPATGGSVGRTDHPAPYGYTPDGTPYKPRGFA